jgi:dihydroorotase
MNSRVSLVLKEVTLPKGRVADISIDQGTVTHVGAGLSSDQTINCFPYLVIPGAIDMHVHMRGGIQSSKEDWRSGSMSALAGGITMVVDQPNTIPPITTVDAFMHRLHEAQVNSVCHFAINSAVTATTDFKAMWHAGAIAFGEAFFAPSSYGEAIGEATLGEALEKIGALGALATIHAEKVAPVPDTDLISHDQARSVQGEVQAVSAAKKCNRANCRMHFCHLSAAASVDAAAGSGSVEVTPHHLFLSLESFDKNDAFGKANPPLRTERERRALWDKWDQIDVIASDHAPHTINEKQDPFSDAPSGIPGVETMVPMLIAQVLEKKISLRSLIDKTSANPAALLGIQKPGFSVGNRADFALYPKTPVRISADILHSKCGWTPFEKRMAAFPVLVVMGGKTVYRNGDFLTGSPRGFHGSGYIP